MPRGLRPLENLHRQRLPLVLCHEVQGLQRLDVVVVYAAVVTRKHVHRQVPIEPGEVVLPQWQLMPHEQDHEVDSRTPFLRLLDAIFGSSGLAISWLSCHLATIILLPICYLWNLERKEAESASSQRVVD